MTSATPAPCDGAVAAATACKTATSHTAATLAATILGSSVAFIDGSVVNVALPALASDLGAGPAELAWSINAYLLPLGALTLFGGAAGDHFGRRRLFLLGMAIFLASSVLCAMSPSVAWLLIGRALQGIGAACLMPNSLAILGAAFDGEARGRAIGTWAAVGAIAGTVGPLIGGWLVDTLGWRAIFLLNLPVGAAAAWLAWRYVTESSDRDIAAPLDWTGATAATLGLGLLTWSLTAATEPASLALVALSAVAGFALLVAFLRVEAKLGNGAMMPLTLFATSTFAGLTILTFFLYAALGGLFVLLPFLLIRVAKYSAIEAGAALLPLPLLIGLGSRMMGRSPRRSAVPCRSRAEQQSSQPGSCYSCTWTATPSTIGSTFCPRRSS
jgi:EmrB/QacA subfamily drug resistance transporter